MSYNKLRSMTGYGEGAASSHGLFSISLHGLNFRSLHIECKLPPPLLKFEVDIRRKIGAQVERGRIAVQVSWSERPKGSTHLQVNEELVQSLFQHTQIPQTAWAGAAHAFGLIHIDQTLGDEKAAKEALLSALGEALEHFIKAKKEEGEILSRDIEGRLEKILHLIAEIEGKLDQEKELLYTNLVARLNKLALPAPPERLAEEAALLVDKADITEEIVRLKAHLRSAQEFISSPCISKGKKLDFFAQELGREASTLGRKVCSPESGCTAIDIKHEVEKIREQLANVE